MGILFLDRKDAELRLQGKSLCVRAGNEPTRQIPAALLERVVLRSDARITAGVLTGLTALGVGVVVLGGRRGERVAHVVGAPHKDVVRRVTQIRRLDDAEFCLAWCQYLVRRKLCAQQRLIRHAMLQRPDQRHALHKATLAIDNCMGEIVRGASVEVVRGLEGAAAAAFFRAYATLFPTSLGFSTRQRRPPPDPVNACLSLGYTLLHGLAVQVCHGQGLDPMIGYLHAPAHGRASLASDVMEPWRPRLDLLVWTLFRERTLTADHFGTDGGHACLLNKAGRSHFYRAWGAQMRPLRNAMRRQVNRVARTIDQLAAEKDEAPSWV